MAELEQPVARSVQKACETAAGTVQALAADVGVSYAALCSWSRGRRRPPPRQLVNLAAVLDARAEELHSLATDLRRQAGAVEARGSSRTREQEDGDRTVTRVPLVAREPVRGDGLTPRAEEMAAGAPRW